MVDYIVPLGKTMRLDVNSGNVEDLVEYYENELVTKENQKLRTEQLEDVV